MHVFDIGVVTLRLSFARGQRKPFTVVPGERFVSPEIFH